MAVKQLFFVALCVAFIIATLFFSCVLLFFCVCNHFFPLLFVLSTFCAVAYPSIHLSAESYIGIGGIQEISLM